MLNFISSMVIISIYKHSICYRVSKCVLSAGKIPPRNRTTKRSLRESKLKELEVGEGSSPGAAKQLEFTLRPKPVIKTYTKKVFTQPSSFGDTEACTRTKETLPHWRERLKNIIQEEFLEYIPHSDLDMRNLNDEFFLNI